MANEIDVLTRFMTEHYPGVKTHLEWFRAEHPEQWSRPDQGVWRQVDKTVPRALVWEWMAFKAELSRRTFLDPKQREIDLEVVRQKARVELTANTHGKSATRLARRHCNGQRLSCPALGRHSIKPSSKNCASMCAS